MTALESTIRLVADALRELERRWALVGGLAVSARAEPRFTRDIDLAVVVENDADAERLVHAMLQRGFETLATVEQKSVGRLATIRLTAPSAKRGAKGVVVDLLFASSGIEDVMVAQADAIQVLPGLTLPVARVGHLLATKVLARDDKRRPQDAADLRALLAEAEADDLALAETTLTLITQRGFARGRDLMAAWRSLLAEQA